MKNISESMLRRMLSEAYDKGREHGAQEQQEKSQSGHGKRVVRHFEKTKMLNSLAGEAQCVR